MIERQITDKILIIGPSPKMKGGIAQVLDTYFHEIFDHPTFIAETVNGNQIKRIIAMLVAAIRLPYTLASKKEIRIVHLHTATRVSFIRSSIFGKIARMMGRKVIMHVHGANFDDYYRSHKSSVTKALKSADKVVALSASWQHFFENEIKLTNVTVIPNIISAPAKIEDRLKYDNVVHGLFLGLIGDRKGIYDLLEAIATHHDALVGRFMLHVGGNGEIDKFKRRVSLLGIDDIVRFHGWVRGAEKEQLLNKSSIYILPSYGEGLPISILEAMAYGNAIISTPIGGIPEVVADDNGILVNPGDTKALGDAISRLVDNPDLIKRMGEASIAKTEPYRSESVERELERMYNQLL